jgi:mannose-6-phosphate isomerase-like protein (cupin superfamily)
MSDDNLLQKNFYNFPDKIDFNFISNLLDKNTFKTEIFSNYLHQYVLESNIRVGELQKHPYFFEISKLLNEKFNENNYDWDLQFFLSLTSGNKSKPHTDTYDVYIIGVYGKTLFKIENQEYYVTPGDLLTIPKGCHHTAIGITPRITLSYGVWPKNN